MKLEDQVCTYEQGAKLIQLGIKNASYFSWEKCELIDNNNEDKKLLWWAVHRPNNGEYEFMTDMIFPEGNWAEEYETIRSAPAFTVAELGLMLPDVDNHEFVWASFPDAGITEEGLDIDPPAFSVFIGPSVRHLEEEPFDNKVYPTEAQARAAFLIYCIENNKTTVEEVNQRLSPSSDK